MLWLVACTGTLDPTDTGRDTGVDVQDTHDTATQENDTGFVETDPTFCDTLNESPNTLEAYDTVAADAFCTAGYNAVHSGYVHVPVPCLCEASVLTVWRDGRVPRLRRADYLTWIANAPDLTSLSNLEEVSTELHLGSEELESLKGIQNVWVNRVEVEDGERLRSLDHLPLTGLKELRIEGNPALEELTAMPAHLDALAFNINPALTSLEGLESLETVGALSLRYTPIESLEPLKNLRTADNLQLRDTALTALSGLENLERASFLYLGANPSLHDLTALDHPVQVEQLVLVDNPALTSADGLGQLTDLYRLEVRNNALPGLAPIPMDDVQVLRWTAPQLKDLTSLSSLTRMESLELSSPNITSLAPLSQLTVARTFSLDQTRLTTLDGPQLRNM